MTQATFEFSGTKDTTPSHRKKTKHRQNCIYLVKKFADRKIEGNDVIKVGQTTDLLNRKSSSEYQNARWLFVANINGVTKKQLEEIERRILIVFRAVYVPQDQPTEDSSYGRELFHIPDGVIKDGPAGPGIDNAIRYITNTIEDYRRNN